MSRSPKESDSATSTGKIRWQPGALGFGGQSEPYTVTSFFCNNLYSGKVISTGLLVFITCQTFIRQFHHSPFIDI